MNWQKIDGSTKGEWFLVDNNNNPLVHIGFRWDESKDYPYSIYQQKPLKFLFNTNIHFATLEGCKKFAEQRVVDWIQSLQ